MLNDFDINDLLIGVVNPASFGNTSGYSKIKLFGWI